MTLRAAAAPPARGMRASVGVILHATEAEPLYRAAFESVLGIGGGCVRVSAAEGHYGNPIRIVSAEARAAGAARVAASVAGAMRPADVGRVCDDIGLHASGAGLHLRFDKQEFVQGRLLLSGSEAVRVRMYVPVYKGGSIEEAYIGLLNRYKPTLGARRGDEDAAAAPV